MKRIVLTIVLAGVSATVIAQTPANPAFEVASVKTNTSTEIIGTGGGPKGGRFNLTRVPLSDIIAVAYQLPRGASLTTPQLLRDRLLGLPEWAWTARFDIDAKAPDGVTLRWPNPIAPLFGDSGPPSSLALMVRGLLVDRFGLKAHTETRDMPVYALVMARSDRKTGSNLLDCNTLPDPKKCGVRLPSFQLRGVGISIAQLGSVLASMTLHRPVVDRTQLPGLYDITLDYLSERPQNPLGPLAALPPTVINPNAPSLTTALQEQLGLKLESTREPVEVLVIDHVERPTDN